MNDIKKIDKSQSIKQSNRLVIARYRLTKYEQRLIMAICSQLSKSANEFETVRVRAGDIADFCNFKGKDKYNQVHTTIVKLMSRTLQIQKDDGRWYVTHWLQSAEYLQGGYIEYCIDQKLKPELLQLKAAYLETQAAPLMTFKRDYSARLYFILKKMLKIKDFEYDLDFFRDRFQLGKTYQQISNLKNRVLEPALKEINALSDIDVKHKYIKEGRTYTKIHFIVTLKEKEKSYEEKLEIAGQTKLLESASTRATRGLTDEQQEAFDSLVNRDVGAKKAKELAKKYESKRIKDNIKLALNQKETTKNIAGLIISFIENNTAGLQEIAKKEAKERIERKSLERRQAYDLAHGTQTAEIGKKTTQKEGKIIEKLKELTDLEVEFIKKKREKAGKRIIEHMEELGLTIDDVIAGKRQ